MDTPPRSGSGLSKNRLVSSYPNLASRDPGLRRDAFDRLVRAVRQQQFNWLQWKIPRLAEHMVAEAIDDTFLELWKQLQRPGWKERWDLTFFQMVAARKGTDRFRQLRSAQKKFGAHQSKIPVNHEEEVEIYGKVESQIEIHDRRAECLKIFDRTLAELPLQQRRIAIILLESQGDNLGPAEAIKLYRRSHKKALTLAAAKSTLAVVRKKLRHAKERETKRVSR